MNDDKDAPDGGDAGSATPESAQGGGHPPPFQRAHVERLRDACDAYLNDERNVRPLQEALADIRRAAGSDSAGSGGDPPPLGDHS